MRRLPIIPAKACHLQQICGVDKEDAPSTIYTPFYK